MKLRTRLIRVLLFGVGLFLILVVLLFGYKDIPLQDLKSKYAKESSAYLDVQGMNVHYCDEGNPSDSIPIVLIHGTGASLHTFDEWTQGLAEEYRVIRMDLPGYGFTGPFPHGDYSIDKYVTFIQAFLNKKGIQQCIIGGNSLGGHIAWKFTADHPDRVSKLILIDAGGYPSNSKSKPLAFRVAEIPLLKNLFKFITPKLIARKSIENVYADKSKVTDELSTRYFELTLRPGNRQAFLDRLEVKYEPEDTVQISSISQSTLILWGEEDLLIPVENAYLFERDLVNDTLVVLKNAGHVPMEESPMLSLSPVLEFLSLTH